jgi:hypothetical protein
LRYLVFGAKQPHVISANVVTLRKATRAKSGERSFMSTEGPGPVITSGEAEERRALTPAAQRALAEAAARRASEVAPRPRELNGRKGPDPVRYGDWEVKGVATDF